MAFEQILSINISKFWTRKKIMQNRPNIFSSD